MRPDYKLLVNHSVHTRIRVFLNGVPLYKGPSVGVAITHVQPANHVLVSGRNTFAMHVLHGPDNANAFFDVTIDYDHEEPIFARQWVATPGAGHLLPAVTMGSFEVEDLGAAPLYLTAPEADFGPEGTPELRRAIEEVHRAFGAGDADALYSLLEPKVQDGVAFYPGESGLAGESMAELRRQLTSGVELAPLEPETLVIERYVDGKVAYVTRVDDRPVIRARLGTGDKFESDLWLTQAGGQGWRMFR